MIDNGLPFLSIYFRIKRLLSENEQINAKFCFAKIFVFKKACAKISFSRKFLVRESFPIIRFRERFRENSEQKCEEVL
jgi:hypothetical protein